MELQKSIENRRSIRKYKNRDISKETIIQLLDCARLSPSAKNIQPWKFYVAKGNTKDTIANFMTDYAKENGTTKYTGMINTGNTIKEAPVLILVFRDNKKLLSRRNDALSIGSAIENILLKATELGLGSLWICATYNIRDKVSKLVNTDLELYSCIAIGYADENPSARPRKDLNDIIMNINEL